MKHFATIKHQFKFIKNLKESMTEEELLVHIDFSENYSCKYATEIQAIHFGGSRNQVTIHTGVAYYLNRDKDRTTFSFATTSASLRHDPSSIWAHLKPVLTEIFKQNRKLRVVHFLSDSPTT